ncbi:uncharacterized protein LOC111044637 [Nilaparvata lugens]|uniref:uncharacterized protein LOC111044637 n=1 Tax=Nilaparvata lugens TaxID=108931 RepID=UPI00193CE240|nr:uncharacterized protein LOC111044637 [Nilaparvata lugens]
MIVSKETIFIYLTINLNIIKTMELNKLFWILIFMTLVIPNLSVISFEIENDGSYYDLKGDSEASNFHEGDDMMVNYYAPYTLKNSETDLENTGDRIQSIISESITKTEGATGRETFTEKTVAGELEHKMRMEDKLSILKALLLTDNSTELATKSSKLTTSSLLTFINFNTTINIISSESKLTSQIKKGYLKPIRGGSSTESVKSVDSSEPGEGSSKPRINIDSNDIKPAIIIALATKCEQIQNRVNSLEQLHKSLKITNDDFSKEISHLEKRLKDVENRQLSEQTHVVPQIKADTKLDEILNKLNFIEHFQLLAKKPLIDSEEMKSTTKNISNPNALLEHYRDALMKAREEKELINIAQQYKQTFEKLKKSQETTTPVRVEPFPTSIKDKTNNQIHNITAISLS